MTCVIENYSEYDGLWLLVKFFYFFYNTIYWDFLKYRLI